MEFYTQNKKTQIMVLMKISYYLEMMKFQEFSMV